MKRLIFAFTDGACKRNPGPGGWGWIYYVDNIQMQDCGGKKLTTNNEMELTAMLKLLRALPRWDVDVHLYSDSTYVLKGLIDGGSGTLNGAPTGWSKSWHQSNWAKPPKNNRLWQKVYRECIKCHNKGVTLHLNWVKGHSGNKGNELADNLANQGCQECIDDKTE